MAFTLPELGFPYEALEPAVDAETMRIHHDKHHGGYVANLNKALEGSEFASKSIEELIAGLSSLPESIRTAVRNNGGGHYNHSLFWKWLSPGGAARPAGSLAAALERDLGGYEGFRTSLAQAGLGRFGSGWAWLVLGGDGKLGLLSTANQDNPLSEGLRPLFGIDVWEHAYYLRYQNRRADYIEALFSVINWSEVAEGYEKLLS